MIKSYTNRTMIVIGAFLMALLILVIGDITSGVATQLLIPNLLSSSAAAEDTISLWTTAITPLLFIGWYAINRNQSQFRLYMPFPRQKVLSRYLFSWLLGALAIIIIWLIGLLSQAFTVTTVWHNTNGLWLLAFLIGFGFQGMSEEIVCRGYLQGKLTQSIGPKTAIIISSLFFAAIHGANNGVTLIALFNLVLFALLMALVRDFTQNLWLCGAFHSAWNFVQGPVLGVHVSGTYPSANILLSQGIAHHTWANGGDFGIEGSLVCSVIYIIMIAGVIYWHKRQQA
ncbi:CPBP family intramembrane glutamic endopeptidase [Convivina intestini]|uniref:CAAX prenyl protease 2/Lysostaphin resistance protein A-like domain-containing protein n=1 Tax=Convivina intestini TaxID=1505726 RepID=A0A2U1D3V9_9LACO|nr:CPBP family intramembrane glutamic endopeptidase [Convivina intestini]PVY82357.1 hypothetical protein C7384_11312 [Convivina intestini]CAH1854548.1 hypothetical protein R078131_00971 [Convivina intestini]CAH1857388.1 hypothetical protein R077811_01486 [Convivina intestini]SDC14670.1 hypothetical protein SAMN05216341_11512 [Leuconostocaceae bacterium R-53105]